MTAMDDMDKENAVKTGDIDVIRKTLSLRPLRPIGLHLTDRDFVDYASDALVTTGHRRVVTHLESCPACAARMEQFLRTSDDIVAELSVAGETWSSWVSEQGQAEADVPDTQLESVRDRAVRLFTAANVFEALGDYELPSGHHTDTHINSAKVCESETTLAVLARLFDEIVPECDYEVIVTTGWQMATLARRMFRDRVRRPQVVLVQGYQRPRMVDAVERGALAAVFTDVVVTGGLLRETQRLMRAHGLAEAGYFALVNAMAVDSHAAVEFQSLCRVEIAVHRASDCMLCRRGTPIQYWNAEASSMSDRRRSPRSPSEFLSEYDDARELWELVDAAGAFEHHRAEGRKHYRGFIDVKRMLIDSATRHKLIGRLVDVLVDRGSRPDVLLVPSRERAQLVAAELVDELRARGQCDPVIVHGFVRGGGRWEVSEGGAERLFGASVLVVDSAVAHGETLDELCLLAREAGALRVGGAVVLSRLSESHERTLDKRLENGFVRLFTYCVPVQEVTESTLTLCEVCASRDELQQSAEVSGLGTIRHLAERSRPRKVGRKEASQRPKQLWLEHPDLLTHCSPAVASGVAQHAVYTAMTDGRAPLALPELVDTTIPAANRAALLRDLPAGIVSLSGDPFRSQIYATLSSETSQAVWLAAAVILAREGEVKWLESLGAFLTRCKKLRTEAQPTFWSTLAHETYRVAQNMELRAEMCHLLRVLEADYAETTAAEGIADLIEAVQAAEQ